MGTLMTVLKRFWPNYKLTEKRIGGRVLVENKTGKMFSRTPQGPANSEHLKFLLFC